MKKSWSGSWLGYHRNVYYKDFQSPPSGAFFSSEWGLQNGLSSYARSNGDWIEYPPHQVLELIKKKAGGHDLEKIRVKSDQAKDEFEKAKSSLLSIISITLNSNNDEYLSNLSEDIKSVKILDSIDLINSRRPRGDLVSEDYRALVEGIKPPPHIAVWADVEAIMSSFNGCKKLKGSIHNLLDHYANLEYSLVKKRKTAERIFIGHGQSKCWKELRDFIRDRLNLPVDEFNRIPVAGITTVDRLSQMLNESCFAFLIMTSDDSQSDGSTNPRMNVVHEAGLFQERLGFNRAIILLENECLEFSNIQGLTQIRFERGGISSIFEKVREVLERENIIKLQTT